MSKTSSLEPLESAVAEASSVAAPAKKMTAAASLELREDEIVQLSIRPSLWFIPLYSLKLVLAMALLAAFVAVYAQGRASLAVTVTLLVIVLAVLSIVLAATLQWASRLYVLTNRRVMQFRGVFSVEVAECGLKQIAQTRLQLAWFQPLLRLGSIQMTPKNQDKPAIVWEHVARPDEVHEILERAIRKAQ